MSFFLCVFLVSFFLLVWFYFVRFFLVLSCSLSRAEICTFFIEKEREKTSQNKTTLTLVAWFLLQPRVVEHVLVPPFPDLPDLNLVPVDMSSLSETESYDSDFEDMSTEDDNPPGPFFLV